MLPKLFEPLFARNYILEKEISVQIKVVQLIKDTMRKYLELLEGNENLDLLNLLYQFFNSSHNFFKIVSGNSVTEQLLL